MDGLHMFLRWTEAGTKDWQAYNIVHKKTEAVTKSL